MKKQNETGLIQNAKMIACQKSYYLPVILTAVLSYGYTLANFVPSTDDLNASFFLKGGLIAQGRFTNSLLACIDMFWESYPFAQDFLAVLLIATAATLLCAIFHIVSGGKIKPGALTAFSCVFVSCPMICEIFVFCGASFNCGFSALFTTAAVWLGYCAVTEKRFSKLALSAVIMFFIVSLYEAYVFVFAVELLFIFVIDYIYKKKENQKLSVYIRQFLIIAVPLVAAVLAELAASSLIQKVLHIEASSYSHLPGWFEGGIGEKLVLLVKQMVAFFVSGLWVFTISIFDVCLLVLAVFAVAALIKTKKPCLTVLYIGIIICSVAIMIVNGGIIQRRTMSTVYFVNAFAVMMLVQKSIESGKTGLKRAVAALVCLLTVWQGSYMTKLFYYEKLMIDADIRTIARINDTVQAQFPNSSKPAIWVGDYEVTEPHYKLGYISKDSAGYQLLYRLLGEKAEPIYPTIGEAYVSARCESTAYSPLSCINNAFGSGNSVLYLYLEYLGYDYTKATLEQYEEAEQKAKDMPLWNTPGGIAETDDYIIVKIGDIESKE